MTNVTVRCEVDDLVKVRDFQVKDFINHHYLATFTRATTQLNQVKYQPFIFVKTS